MVGKFVILVPPVIMTPKFKPISGGNLKWIRAEDQLPMGALIGGFENETLYIIRAAHMASLTPGKFVSSQGTAYIPWGGDEHPKSEFEVCCLFYFIIYTQTDTEKDFLKNFSFYFAL